MSRKLPRDPNPKNYNVHNICIRIIGWGNQAKIISDIIIINRDQNRNNSNNNEQRTKQVSSNGEMG